MAATSGGPVCLTILPQAFLAGGVPIDTSETVVADFAALCHRHGVGAVNLDGRATPEAWQAFFVLLARRPEEVRGAGGIQRQWKALRHTSPAILEIDFGALLRGKVGGDYLELAGRHQPLPGNGRRRRVDSGRPVRRAPPGHRHRP